MQAASGWLRGLLIVLAALLLVAAGLYQLGSNAEQRRRAEAAQRLAAASPVTSAPAVTPTPTPTEPPASATAPAAPARTQVGLPPAAFSWPAAGFAVDIAPMDWSRDTPVDPALDPNGFDPIGHWLKGTGESDEYLPVVLAGHTCHTDVYLCSPTTFPFNLLSYDGWAVGQPASITDSRGTTIPCLLQDRRIVDKSKQFSFSNDPCLVVLFTCNVKNPDEAVTLVSFRCGQCT